MPQVAVAIAGAISAFTATTVGTFLTTTITGRLLTSVALSALQVALGPKPKSPGITTERRATGGTNPCAFPLGLTATAGDEVCPPMTHGKAGKTPNAYLTMVIALSDVPGTALSRLAIDNEWVTMGGAAHPDYGTPITGRYMGYAWIKFYNGTQTVADPMLLAKYSAHPERPWAANMRGTGIAYAILTFRFNRNLFPNEPQCLFELTSIPLYDPRKDTTVGGSGTHRWTNKATWAASNNPKVIDYNILRGIEVPTHGIWGGAAEADDLPLTNWFTAMNECDVNIATLAGNVAQYRAGTEVRISTPPAEISDEVNKACTGQIAEVGGQFKTRVGGPGLPVLFITDDDFIVTKPQDLDPFDKADGRANAIDAKYPDPASVWAPKSAPTITNATWEAQDGERRLTTLDLPACPYPAQVQRVMRSYIADGRRARKHGGTLPPDAAVLEPLDTLSWTSTRNGYVGKAFELAELADGPRTMLQQVSMREVDPADYTPPNGWEVAVTAGSGAPITVPTQTVTGFAVAPYTLLDALSAARRPAIRIIWDGDEQDGVRAIQYEVTLSGGQLVKRGSVTDVEAGEIIIADGVLANTTYAARIRPVADWPTAWTAILTATTPGVLISTADLNVVGHSAGALNSDPEMVDIAAWTRINGGTIAVATDTTLPSGNTVIEAVGPSGQLWSRRFQIATNRNYFIDCWARGLSGTTAYLACQFFDASGTLISSGLSGWLGLGSNTYYWGLAAAVIPAAWTRYSLAFGPDEVAKIPAAARTMRIGALTNFSGSGTQRFGHLAVYEQTQRTNLDPNSLQDVYRTVNAAYYTRATAPANTVLATLNIGAISSGILLRRGIHFEARRPGDIDFGLTTGPIVELQTRRRQLGSGFSAWASQVTWNTSALFDEGSGIGPWQQISHAGSISEPADEFEYRFIVLVTFPNSNANTWIGNVWLTVAAITKGGA